MKNKTISPVRRANLERMLDEHRDKVAAELRALVDGLKESRRSETEMGKGDPADDDVKTDLIRMKSGELDRIDAARGRLARGLYGFCFECGDPIDLARLDALLFAIRCITCEEDHEIAVETERLARKK